jgi:hypothetical protein
MNAAGLAKTRLAKSVDSALKRGRAARILPEPDRSLDIDGSECVDALKIENAIARQR